MKFRSGDERLGEELEKIYGDDDHSWTCIHQSSSIIY
jgi:hypothetical protein